MSRAAVADSVLKDIGRSPVAQAARFRVDSVLAFLAL
jgi:hypothetical protein